jgi:phospholipid transport system substrate-binding protein
MMSSKYRYLNCGLLISVLLLALAPTAGAESAKEQLQGTIDSVVEVLRTIRSQEDIERNRKSLRQILLTRFDFAAMAQTSLGKRWNDLKGEEGEFVSAFTDFVEHSYMSTLGSYQGEKVVYDSDWANGESAEVDTRVVGGQGSPIKIGYKLHLRGEQWMVYDAVIDDVSVVGNYRAQFARILHTASLEELIQNLRAKASGR